MNLNHLTKLANNLPWLVRYPSVRANSLLGKSSDKPKHIIFTVANHFEPNWSANGLLNLDAQRRRLDDYHKLARKTGEAVIDADGTKFRHTNFFPRRTIRLCNFRNDSGDASRRFGRSGNSSASRR